MARQLTKNALKMKKKTNNFKVICILSVKIIYAGIKLFNKGIEK